MSIGSHSSSCSCSCACCGYKSNIRETSWYLYADSPSCKALLHSSVSPCPQECAAIQERIDEAGMELERLRQRKEKLSKALTETEKEIEEIQNAERKYESLISPIRRLPFDMLQEIFFAYQESWREQIVLDCPRDNKLRLLLQNGPWELGSICSKWRDIAISTPKLWCTIAMTGFHPSTLSNGHLMLLWEGLKRSGSCKLDVHITSLVDLTQLSQPLSMLLAHSSRFQRLSLLLGFDGARDFSPLETQLKGKLPSLTTLELFSKSSSSMASLTAFKDAPQLRSVTLAVEHPLEAQLPWDQLEAVKFHHATPINTFQCLTILLRCSNLTECCITKFEPVDLGLRNFPNRLLHRSLQLLETKDSTVFGYVTLPSLAKLHIKEVMRDGDICTLDSMLDRSGCRLESLSMILLSSKFDKILLSPSMDTLKNLDLELSAMSYLLPLLGLMTPIPRSEDHKKTKSILPKLEHFRLSIGATLPPYTSEIFQSLFHMLSFRCNDDGNEPADVACLHSFKLHYRGYSSYSQEKILKLLSPYVISLKEWIAHGLEITLFGDEILNSLARTDSQLDRSNKCVVLPTIFDTA